MSDQGRTDEPGDTGEPAGIGAAIARLRMYERLLDDLDRQVHHSAERVTGGLLIGYPTESGLWVERVLPVRNIAGPGEAAAQYRIDTRVLHNVRSTLSGTPLSVLGFYYGGGSLPRGSRVDATHLRLERHTVWLLPTSNGGGRTAPAVWRDRGDGLDEVQVELVAAQVRSPIYCPE